MKVIIDHKRKGDKLIVNHTQLHQYLEQKLHDLTNSMSNTITALIILSIMVLIQTFKASDIYLYGLILLPLIARGFVYNRISKSLQKRFEELLTL
ncbi:MAG: hypothetical protein JSV47_12320 [Deltaproteobacteria bacterium]|nr:MAG: hypothetical protein JSV47_12320 [Deltaproteobacteria bacterium]